jgi:hypothetical protein
MRHFVGFAAFVAAFVASSGLASAQTDGRAGCTRDVTRYCRPVMDNGDMAVLACLKQNRAKLGKACQKVLTDNNQ